MTQSATDAPRGAPGSGQGASSASRQKAFHSAKSYEDSATQIGDIEPVTVSDKDKVRRVCAEGLLRIEPDATGEDLKELLMMLGIHSSQPDWDDGPKTTPQQLRSY